MKSDEIEEVTDEMLKILIDTNPHVAVIFCKWNQFTFCCLNSYVIVAEIKCIDLDSIFELKSCFRRQE